MYSLLMKFNFDFIFNFAVLILYLIYKKGKDVCRTQQYKYTNIGKKYHLRKIINWELSH